MDSPGFKCQQGQEVLFSKMPRPALGPSEPPIQWVLESVSGQGNDVDFCLSLSTEVKNEWTYTPIPCITLLFFHSRSHHYHRN